jgi:hypothetical protein
VNGNADLEEFRRQIAELIDHPLIKLHVSKGELNFRGLTRNEISHLMKNDAAYYFLIAAANLNRTTLKEAMKSDAAQIVPKSQRRAFAVQNALPIRRAFADVANAAVVLRRGDLQRRTKGSVEALFRERLAAERIPILMSPPSHHVPGVLIGRRKPDGVYPDPATGTAPLVYLEIKNVRRVADDIQKRLYEIAEASLEMKLLYGSIQLKGLGLTRTTDVRNTVDTIRARIRRRIVASKPTVIALLLCSRNEAGRYRAGAEAFVDRVFFQEEIDDCLSFLRDIVQS